ncbi:Mud1p ASCRUDRAFT_15529 [Ascoidea rubescens DSM 1968]|uniref:RRM domain-containing protein n=1 Tax=Ascoidea rubescens DSM 1968 TaxID=1344418 RepID=A0A1D2VAF7_9ASCO|nr:hypothetical protein ASCRUDRAFT_15529 [Ascoidea rubescens DSM 1968]ODV58601.1 hypothetical protein ASCRUDRAFT_15529 [Ascoidea rubescens DSM 1968]
MQADQSALVPDSDLNAHHDSNVSTIYLKNLNEKISINNLKKFLSTIFNNPSSDWYPILSITAHKNLRMRGQAFISFESHLKCSKFYQFFNNDNNDNSINLNNIIKLNLQLNAKSETYKDNLLPFKKNTEIYLAKANSDSNLKFNLNESDFQSYLNNRKSLKLKREQERLNSKKTLSSFTTNQNKNNSGSDGNINNYNNKTKKEPMIDINLLPPNKLLLIQNLPKDLSAEQLNSTLNSTFQKFHGFVEIRLVKVRNLAFIEYETDNDAIIAKQNTSDLLISNVKPIISYTKK